MAEFMPAFYTARLSLIDNASTTCLDSLLFPPLPVNVAAVNDFHVRAAS